MPIKILVPELGESIVVATVGPWRKQEGAQVALGETIVELETDKVNLEVSAERAGILTRIEKKEGEDVKPGDVLGVVTELEAITEKAPVLPETNKSEEPVREDGRDRERTTPVAVRFAEERGVDITQVTPSNPGARVTKQDVEKFLAQQKSAPPDETKPVAQQSPREIAPVQAAPIPAAPRAAREERIRMSRRRRTIAQRLVEAHQTAAILTTFNEINMSAVIEIRKRRKDSFKLEYGVSLGFMSFFVKAAIGALRAFPRVNAEIQQDEIVLKHYYDIGIAVGAEEGLVVPVLRDADQMSFAEIERAIDAYVQKTRERTLSIEDLRGGTFTITNGGIFGSLLSTPIINTPQVGILGLHKIEARPIALNGQVVICPMMYVALSYDHRIVDGREAVQFLARIKTLIEDPEVMMLEG